MCHDYETGMQKCTHARSLCSSQQGFVEFCTHMPWKWAQPALFKMSQGWMDNWIDCHHSTPQFLNHLLCPFWVQRHSREWQYTTIFCILCACHDIRQKCRCSVPNQSYNSVMQPKLKSWAYWNRLCSTEYSVKVSTMPISSLVASIWQLHCITNKLQKWNQIKSSFSRSKRALLLWEKRVFTLTCFRIWHHCPNQLSEKKLY